MVAEQKYKQFSYHLAHLSTSLTGHKSRRFFKELERPEKENLQRKIFKREFGTEPIYKADSPWFKMCS